MLANTSSITAGWSGFSALEGREEAEIGVYLEAKEKLHSIHCWSVDRSGREFELKDKDFTERGAFFGFDLYNDVRLRTGPVREPILVP